MDVCAMTVLYRLLNLVLIDSPVVSLVRLTNNHITSCTDNLQGGSSMDGVMREMPKYLCHKEVHALKIAKIERDNPPENCETDGSAMVTPADEGYAPFKVDSAYMSKHKPVEGGYFVVYEDGYKSFSPAEAFESGYSRI
jgi:hypothetical protein